MNTIDTAQYAEWSHLLAERDAALSDAETWHAKWVEGQSRETALRSTVDVLTDQYRMAGTELARIAKDRESLNSEIARLTAERDALAKRVGRALVEMQGRIDGLTAERDLLASTFGWMQVQRQAAWDGLAAANAEVDKLERENTGLGKAIARLTREREEMAAWIRVVGEEVDSRGDRTATLAAIRAIMADHSAGAGKPIDDPDDICGLCGQPGADKMAHPVHWPGEQVPDGPLVHESCEDEECRRAHALLTDKQRADFLRNI